MIKINYPTNIEGLKKEYLNIFSKLSLCPIAQDILTKLSISKDDLLIGSFDKLVDYCQKFKRLKDNKTISERNIKILQTEAKILYKKYSYSIADFFINPKHNFQISTCYYCDMSYINSFEDNTKRQFDIDHLIPKTDYPIVALSLFNFVPSCKVCNSTIKGTKNLISIDDKLQAIKLSPTSDKYDFDNKVKVLAIPQVKQYSTFFEKDSEKFQISFETTDSDYQKEIIFFHLNERYDYHKLLALRLLEKQERYPDSNIKKISEILKIDEKKIREDIFNDKFVEDYHRTFSKLYKDIMECY